MHKTPCFDYAKLKKFFASQSMTRSFRDDEICVVCLSQHKRISINATQHAHMHPKNTYAMRSSHDKAFTRENNDSTIYTNTFHFTRQLRETIHRIPFKSFFFWNKFFVMFILFFFFLLLKEIEIKTHESLFSFIFWFVAE